MFVTWTNRKCSTPGSHRHLGCFQTVCMFVSKQMFCCSCIMRVQIRETAAKITTTHLFCSHRPTGSRLFVLFCLMGYELFFPMSMRNGTQPVFIFSSKWNWLYLLWFSNGTCFCLPFSHLSETVSTSEATLVSECETDGCCSPHKHCGLGPFGALCITLHCSTRLDLNRLYRVPYVCSGARF